MSTAIKDLEAEHEAIISALAILDAVAAGIGRGAEADREDIRAFIAFLREFADKCHHGKEEGMLFPALRAAGVGEEGSPLAALLSEHREGRTLVGRMDQAIGENDMAAFASAAAEYSRLLKQHIRTENDVLFPLAARSLSPSMLRDLADAFEEHEDKVIGKGRHEELHVLLDRLRARYLAR